MTFSDKITSNTLVDYPRLENLVKYMKETSSVEGEVAEVGVYKGGTAYLLASLYHRFSRNLYLFDTFNGMPPVAAIDLHREGDFADTSLEQVAKLVDVFLSVCIYKGIFPRVNSEYVSFKKFSLVHLDVDIYDSVKECLEFFAPRMSEGGIIVLDDYLEPNCPGAKLAADEFCKLNGLVVTPTVQSQAIIKF